MSKIKNPFALAAIALFAAHKELNQVYITSDGQGFTNGHKADDHAKYLDNKEVQKFKRDFEDDYSEGDGDSKIEKVVNLEDEKLRAQLLADYENLYGEKAPDHLDTAALTAEIAKKRDEAKGGAENTENKGKNPDADTEKQSDREKLAAEYKELFGKEPAHNAKTETIAEKIAEKRVAK